jgi:hypothetical protein
MKTPGRQKQWLPALPGIMSIIIILFFGYQNGSSMIDIIKLSILSIIIIFIISIYINTQPIKLKDLPYFNSLMISAYSLSMLLIMMTNGKVEFHLWLLGGLCIAMCLDVYVGFLVTYNLIFFASIAGVWSIDSIVYILILGTVLCLLSKFIKNSTTIGYATIIIISLQIIFQFILHNFMIRDVLNFNAVISVLSSLIIIGFAFGIYQMYHKIVLTEVDLKDLDLIAGTHNWDEIIDPNFPLIQRLNQFSPKLYNHSLLISELAGKAAIAIGANEKIARAGGLYHEIGRIVNKQYIVEGVKLVQDYHLPEAVADIIKQHNLKYNKPKSIEAAIVMITISIIDTKEYLEKTTVAETTDSKGKNISVSIEKIVDSVFQMRLTKGSLDESGLNLKQYNKLKEFYLHMK